MFYHPWPVIRLRTIDSTNNYANSLLINNEIVGETVVRADFQTAGRGQSGTTWYSEPYNNLTFSLVLFTGYLNAKNQFSLLQTISLALKEFLIANGIQAFIKWPNDIISNERKICGILIENSVTNDFLTHSVIGIGLNVNQEKFNSFRPGAISMRKITGTLYDIDDVFHSLLFHISRKLELLKNVKFRKIKRDYLEGLFRFKEQVDFIAGDKKFSGKIIDVESTGRLVILSDTGRKRKFLFKEVGFKNY
jgi:BirA family transcriptional regulator, biotin operon repressor / biotin---[acetyl-CoA-carboxylase] ligase